MANPLYELLRAETPFVMTPKRIDAFNEIKNALTSFPVLRQPDFKKEFFLYTDASNVALGAVLAQKDENKHDYVIEYCSKAFDKFQRNYSTSDKECMAVVYAIKKFRYYLDSRKFTVITDHVSLRYLMNISEPTGRLARWAIFLQSNTFDIEHRSGVKHINADYLSRPIDKQVPEQINAIKYINMFNIAVEEQTGKNSKFCDHIENEALIHFVKFAKHKKGISKNQIKRIENEAQNLNFKDNVLYITIGEKELIIPKLDEREDLIVQAHQFGHFATESTYNRLKERYFWRGMKKDIEKEIFKCLDCLQYKTVSNLEHEARVTKIDKIYKTVAVDLSFGLPVDENGYKGIIAITEYLTKLAYVRPIRSKTAKEIGDHLLEYICLFGPFDEIVHDFGKEYANETVKSILESSNIISKVTSAYNPRSNGLCERFIFNFTESLRSMCKDDYENWPKYVKFVQLAYNTRVHSTTKYSPLELLTGTITNPFIDFTKKEMKNLANCTSDDYALHELRNLQEKKRNLAIEEIEKAQSRQLRNQNNSHRITTNRLQIGTEVYVAVKSLNNKLHKKYEGPFKVVSVDELRGTYKLSNKQGKILNDTFQLNRLKLTKDSGNLENDKDINEIVNDVNKNSNKNHKSNESINNRKSTKNLRKMTTPVRRSARLQNIPQILLLCIISLLIAPLLSETPFIPDIDILTMSITNEMNKDYSRSTNSNEWKANMKLLENCKEKRKNFRIETFWVKPNG